MMATPEFGPKKGTKMEISVTNNNGTITTYWFDPTSFQAIKEFYQNLKNDGVIKNFIAK